MARKERPSELHKDTVSDTVCCTADGVSDLAQDSVLLALSGSGHLAGPTALSSCRAPQVTPCVMSE